MDPRKAETGVWERKCVVKRWGEIVDHVWILSRFVFAWHWRQNRVSDDETMLFIQIGLSVSCPYGIIITDNFLIGY